MQRQQIRIEVDRESSGFQEFLHKNRRTHLDFHRELLPLLCEWIVQRRHTIAKTLMRVERAQLYVFHGQREQSYDFALGEDVSQLLLDLTHVFEWPAVESMQMPDNPSFEKLREFMKCVAWDD